MGRWVSELVWQWSDTMDGADLSHESFTAITPAGLRPR